MRVPSIATTSAHELFAHGAEKEPLGRWTMQYVPRKYLDRFPPDVRNPITVKAKQESRSHGESQLNDKNLRSALPVREGMEATNTAPQSHCSSTRVLPELRGPARKACCESRLGRVCNPPIECQRSESREVAADVARVLARSARLSHASDTAGTS